MKKAFLPLSLMVFATTTFASVQSIPKALRDLEAIKSQQQGRYVLKSSKGLMETAPANWFNLSPIQGVEGVGTEEVYKNFGMPTSKDIIVAVIDSGVDVNHEDLQGKIWINTAEIPNNGIDDDNNGFTDDVFGWNFIGGSKGMGTIAVDTTLANGIRLIKGDPAAQVSSDNLEVTRELVRMRKVKATLESIGESLSPEKQAYLDKIEKEVTDGKVTADSTLARFKPMLEKMQKGVAVLKAAGLTEITEGSVRDLESTDPAVIQAKKDVLGLLASGYSEARLIRIVDYYGSQADFYYNTDFNARAVVGDNYSNPRESVYGNNDVIGPDSSHGTHVSGIIAANRDNALGIKGVAQNVKIMAVRVVPDGDERDKDVANGIRYAVDNGAKIINMSFGKAFSPYKKVVDEAIAYAESKGVLMVHAAGNSNQNNDSEPNFPNRKLSVESRQAINWLEIGASSFQKGEELPADFSNFGKFSVDIFAPGVDILSTTPDNKYDTYSGTSMASPAAAGVAALVLSYNESMSLADLRALIVDTSRRFPKLYVRKPGTAEQVLFSDLSINGSITDAYEAVTSVVEQKKRK
ncbi:MAG: S8 family serine peptidase [Bacteriovoracaceae bacterium]|nr:S8 family serine peptidase [Bacteriovoracaceae bacterium]